MSPLRLIFHCDCNNFFASCECLERPELRLVPMAVAGDTESRRGVVVAKNELAKRRGVQTTDTVWQAKKKCPELVFVPPQHELYERVSQQINKIYLSYTDRVEPASIDESYLDLTGTLSYYGMTAEELADSIRARVRLEVGVTISVGVSFNKTFAKMGSDYKKPDATTVVTEENYKALLWPLPVENMLFIGAAAAEKLKKKDVFTIGNLAALPREQVVKLLGKGGVSVWRASNGMDDAPVRRFADRTEVKSVSRGMTFKRDLIALDEVKQAVAALAGEVAVQLREEKLKGRVIQVQIKTPILTVYSRQLTLPFATCTQQEVETHALNLIRKNWRVGASAPIRALTVGVSGLVEASEATEQISFLDMFEADVQNSGTGALSRGYRSYAERERREKLEAAVDAIRRKHGENAIIQGNTGNPEIGLEGAWKRKKEAKRNPEADVLSPRADQKGGSADRSAQAHSAADQNTAKQKNHEK